MCKIWSRKYKICSSLNIWFVLLFVVIVLAILGTVLGALPIGIPPEDERIYTVFVHRIYKVFINLETILSTDIKLTKALKVFYSYCVLLEG